MYSPYDEILSASSLAHLDVLDGLGRGDALDGGLAAELLHLLAALRDGRRKLRGQEAAEFNKCTSVNNRLGGVHCY